MASDSAPAAAVRKMDPSPYRPAYTIPKEEDQDLVTKVLKEENFVTLISVRDDFTPQVTHLPLVYSTTPLLTPEEEAVYLEEAQASGNAKSSSSSEASKPLFYLHGHMALANPHWRRMMEAPDREVLVIFHGPHTYISPLWYPTPQGQVPTWNYVVVHVKALPRVFRDNQRYNGVKERVVVKLSDQEERRTHGDDPNTPRWDLYSTNGPDDIRTNLNNIVAFELRVTQVTPKFKLGGNLPEEEHDTLKQNLQKRNDSTVPYMR